MENSIIEFRERESFFDSILPFGLVSYFIFIFSKSIIYTILGLVFCILYFVRIKNNGFYFFENHIRIRNGIIKKRDTLLDYKLIKKVRIKEILSTTSLQKCIILYIDGDLEYSFVTTSKESYKVQKLIVFFREKGIFVDVDLEK